MNEKAEKIKYKICKEDLYVDISKFNNVNKSENKDKTHKIKKLDNLKNCIKKI